MRLDHNLAGRGTLAAWSGAGQAVPGRRAAKQEAGSRTADRAATGVGAVRAGVGQVAAWRKPGDNAAAAAPCRQHRDDRPQPRIPFPPGVGGGRRRARRGQPLRRSGAGQPRRRRLQWPGDVGRCPAAQAVPAEHRGAPRQAGGGPRPRRHLCVARQGAVDHRTARQPRHARGGGRTVAVAPHAPRRDRRGAARDPVRRAPLPDARSRTGKWRSRRAGARSQCQCRAGVGRGGQDRAGDALDRGHGGRTRSRLQQGDRLLHRPASRLRARRRSRRCPRLARRRRRDEVDPGAVRHRAGRAQVHVGGARGRAPQAGGRHPRATAG